MKDNKLFICFGLGFIILGFIFIILYSNYAITSEIKGISFLSGGVFYAVSGFAMIWFEIKINRVRDEIKTTNH